jgi:aldehyde dehydrogenase (NAD+)
MTVELPASELYIDGSRSPGEGEVVAVLNPATEAVLGEVASATVEQCDAAIASARCAFDDGPWSRFGGRERQAAITRLQDALAARVDEISAMVVAEVGTTAAATKSHQVGLPIEHLGYWAEAAARPDLVAVPPAVVPRGPMSWLASWTVRREPVGVVAAITAYNFPFLLNIMKIGPALAAGNTVVLKPSPFTPYSALVLADAAEDAGLPHGVLNVVTGGNDVGTRMTTDARVDLVTFTGSDTVGSAIMGQAAPTLKRVLLELGGKSPLIVRHDADIGVAASVGLQGFTFHAGQGCALCTRHLVHRSRIDSYVAEVTALASKLSVGDPALPTTNVGPLIRPFAVERTRRYVDGAVTLGAHVETGGGPPPDVDRGFFFSPTLLTGVDNRWPVAQEEIFGPVGVVIAFDSDDEAVAIANDSRYGLDGHVVSEDVGAAFRMACALRTGGVSINGGAGVTSPAVPFGGYKRSGLGRENGEPGLDEYTQLKTIKYHGG